MTLEQFAYLAEIIAALAVIASLIYIGNELRQNTEALQAQSRYNLITLRTSAIRALKEDRSFLDASHRFVDGEEVSKAEETAIKLFANELLEMWEWQHGEFQAGTLPMKRLPVENWRRMYHEKLVPNAVSKVWGNRKNVYNDEFIQFMEENVVNER
jgi:hypothetical protein